MIKLNADESKSNGTYVRVEIRGKAQFGPGMDRWVTSEVFVPNDTPTIPSSSRFWTIESIFGPVLGVGARASFHLKRNIAGTGNTRPDRCRPEARQSGGRRRRRVLGTSWSRHYRVQHERVAGL